MSIIHLHERAHLFIQMLKTALKKAGYRSRVDFHYHKNYISFEHKYYTDVDKIYTDTYKKYNTMITVFPTFYQNNTIPCVCPTEIVIE